MTIDRWSYRARSESCAACRRRHWISANRRISRFDGQATHQHGDTHSGSHPSIAAARAALSWRVLPTP